MILIKKSPFSGVENRVELPFSEETFTALHERWVNGEVIQSVFHMLDANTREFIATGLLPDEWDKLHLTEDDDELEEELEAEDC
jgi:hypothetical protein